MKVTPARLGFPGAPPQRRVVWMWFGAFPGAFGLGRAQPQRRGVVSAAPDDLRIPSPRRPACWRWACGPRWYLRSPLTLPRVLHEALHEPASAWGSHRGSGGHRPGWGLPRAVKHPHCGPTGQGRRGWKLPVSASQRQSTRPGGSSEPSPRVGGRAGRAQDIICTQNDDSKTSIYSCCA